MPVCDEALDIAVRTAVSEVRMCFKSRVKVMNISVVITISSRDNLFSCQCVIF